MKKIVGIPDNCKPDNVSVGVNYTNAVIKGGNIPFVLPRTDDRDLVVQMIDKVDAVLLPGGCDIAPSLFGEEPSPFIGEVVPERDAFEFLVLEECVKQCKSVLGICRGIQVVNVFFGGTLYQDLASEYDPEATIHQRPDKQWDPVHNISIVENSKLSKLLGRNNIDVNSTHHQAIKKVANDFCVTAISEDGIIEAIESDRYPILCVQFHPERLIKPDDSPFIELFKFEW